MSGSGKPLGSTDFQDLPINMANMDKIVNSNETEITNRATPDGNIKTLTVKGMQDLFAMTPINLPSGQWAAGVEFTAINQYMSFNGTGYKPKKDTPLPYTSLGADPTIAPDLANVEPFNDATQEYVKQQIPKMTNLQATSVADMIAGITIDSIVNHKVGQVWSTGGTTWKLVSTPTPIELTTGIYAELVGVATANDWGIDKTGVASNTSIYDTIISQLSDGSRIDFLSGTYKGNFVSEEKAFHITRNDAVFINDSNSEAIFRIGELNATEYPVVESELLHFSRQFNVASASTLFNVGDIGYLWDSAVRATGGDVNFEAVKIESISGNVITVVGFLASYKGAGAIKFYHSSKQLKNVNIDGGFFEPTSTHTSFCDAVFNSEKVRVKNHESVGATGNSCAIRYCYDFNGEGFRPKKPAATGSGQGYGLALLGVSHFKVDSVIGQACRHAYDQDSAYFGKISNIVDMEAESVPCMLAHNGFTGHIDVDVVRCKTKQYPVNLSAQGYGGAVSAERGKHPFRSVHIKTIDATIHENISPNDFNVSAAYFENSVIDCTINGVDVNYLNQDALTNANNSNLIRVNGLMQGATQFSNLSVDRIGNILFSNGDRGTLSKERIKTQLVNVTAESVGRIATLQGDHSLELESADITGNVLQDDLILMQDISGDVPVYVRYRAVDYPTPLTKAFLNTDGFVIEGDAPLSARNTGATVLVVEGKTLTTAELQNRSSFVQLEPPVGSGTVNLNLPTPNVNGQEMYLNHVGGARFTMSFAAGAEIFAAFTIAPNETARLISYSGKWKMVGKNTV